jgi:hypothetical protein
MSEHVESEQNPEPGPSKEEIIEAAGDYLSDEDIAELTDDPDEVYNDVVELLVVQDVDWETLFRQKGIIE